MSTKVLRTQPSNGDSNVAKVQISLYTPRNDVDHICHCETTQVGCGNPPFIRFELLC